MSEKLMPWEKQPSVAQLKRAIETLKKYKGTEEEVAKYQRQLSDLEMSKKEQARERARERRNGNR